MSTVFKTCTFVLLSLLQSATAIGAPTILVTADNQIGIYTGGTLWMRTAQFNGAPIDARLNAIASVSRYGGHHVAANLNEGGSALYRVTWSHNLHEAAQLTFVSALASSTPSFDFVREGNSTRLIGTRVASGNSRFFESTDASFTSFQDIGTPGVWTGAPFAFPASGFDAAHNRYLAVDGTQERSIYTIDRGTGVATDTGLDLSFSAAYGNIQLSGGDVADNGVFYVSFYSHAQHALIVGSVNLWRGQFNEVKRFGMASAPTSTGLAIVVPSPLAATMSIPGLALAASRRRRVADTNRFAC